MTVREAAPRTRDGGAEIATRPGQRSRTPCRFMVFLFLLAFPLIALGKSPALTGLLCRFQEGLVLITFQVAEALQRDDVKEAIQSTRPITLTYIIELRKNRPLWPDKTVSQVVLKRTVIYDNLTQQYTVNSILNGKETEPMVLDGWDEVKDLLGNVRDLPVAHVGDLEPGERQYIVRAKVHLLSNSFIWIIPKDLETDWKEIDLVTP